jgi:hypothetical protein
MERINQIRGTLNPSRYQTAVAAQERLEKYNIKIGDKFKYQHAPEYIAESRLGDLKEVKEVISAYKLNLISVFNDDNLKKQVRTRTRHEIFNLLPISIQWTEFIEFKFLDLIEKSNEPSMCTPVAGPITLVREMIRTYGAGAESIGVYDLLRKMRKIYDIDYPDVNRPEELLEFIFSTPYYKDVEFIKMFLLSTGVSSSVTSQLALDIVSASINYPELHTMQSWSNSDSVIGLINISVPSMEKHVIVYEEQPLTETITGMLSQIGFLLSVTNPPFRKVSVKAGIAFHDFMYDRLFIKPI